MCKAERTVWSLALSLPLSMCTLFTWWNSHIRCVATAHRKHIRTNERLYKKTQECSLQRKALYVLMLSLSESWRIKTKSLLLVCPCIGLLCFVLVVDSSCQVFVSPGLVSSVWALCLGYIHWWIYSKWFIIIFCFTVHAFSLTATNLIESCAYMMRFFVQWVH